MIKKKTIDNALKLLVLMKSLCESNVKLNPRSISKQCGVSFTFPYVAIKIGFFEKNDKNILKCKKEFFDYSDARKLVEYANTMYYKKVTREKVTLLSYGTNKPINEIPVEDLINEIKRRGWTGELFPPVKSIKL